MKRQIKFRGRSLTNGKWVCGDSIKHTENASENGTEVLTYIGSRVPNARKVGAMKWIPVDPGSIGQFTGLLDRNGREIYEGDVVEIISYYTSPREKEMSRTRAVIMFDETLAYFLGKSKSASFAMSCASNMEVIGNIHEQSKSQNDEICPFCRPKDFMEYNSMTEEEFEEYNTIERKIWINR